MTDGPLLPLAGVRGTAPAGESSTRQQVALAAREFEAMFLLQMLKQMRQSMLDASEEPGLGAATMTDTVDAELARSLAGRPGGLFDILQRAFGGDTPTEPKPLHPVAVPAQIPVAPVAAGVEEAAVRRQAAGGSLELPSGRVSSGFGWRSDPLSGESRFHKGIDVAAAYGTAVPAAGGGRVVAAGAQRGYGNTVVVQHADGLRTRYAHLSHIDVASGEQVTPGQTLGRVGRSGRATGTHLHFEVLQDGKPVDPAAAVRTGGFKSAALIADYPVGSAHTRPLLTGADDEN